MRFYTKGCPFLAYINGNNLYLTKKDEFLMIYFFTVASTLNALCAFKGLYAKNDYIFTNINARTKLYTSKRSPGSALLIF